MPKQPCRRRPKCGEEKGPRPVCLFLANTADKSCPDGNVKNAVGSKSLAQLTDEISLCTCDLARGAMAHERDLLCRDTVKQLPSRPLEGSSPRRTSSPRRA